MVKTGNIDSLVQLASSQWGLFTSAQALAEGVSRTQLSRMVADGRIEPTSYGTYRLTAGEETARCGVKSAWLSLYPKATAYERLKARPRDAVVIGRTAAVMHGDTDLYEMPYAFAVAKGKRTAREDVELRPWRVEERDVEAIGGLPVASIERTVADLVRMGEDPSLLGNFISGVCRRGHVVDEARLAELLAPLAARNGYGKGDGASFARRLVADHADAGQVRLGAKAFLRALEASPSYWELLRKAAEAAGNAESLLSKVNVPDVAELPAVKAIGRIQEAIGPYARLYEGVESAVKAAQPTFDAVSRIATPGVIENMKAVAALSAADAGSGAGSAGAERGDDEVQDS